MILSSHSLGGDLSGHRLGARLACGSVYQTPFVEHDTPMAVPGGALKQEPRLGRNVRN